MYGPPPICKQNLSREWIGLLKCIRPVRGAQLLAMMESARRWSIKWVELEGSHSHAGLSNAGCDRSLTHGSVSQTRKRITMLVAAGSEMWKSAFFADFHTRWESQLF